MATRPPLTARRIRLGVELRKLRERAGMSSTDAAGALGSVQAQISNKAVTGLHPPCNPRTVRGRSMASRMWQQSSFCGEGDACLQLSAAEGRMIRLRESEEPKTDRHMGAASRGWVRASAALSSITMAPPCSVLRLATARAQPRSFSHPPFAGRSKVVLATSRAGLRDFLVAIKTGESDLLRP
jgi:hypothetical protein